MQAAIDHLGEGALHVGVLERVAERALVGRLDQHVGEIGDPVARAEGRSHERADRGRLERLGETELAAEAAAVLRGPAKLEHRLSLRGRE